MVFCIAMILTYAFGFNMLASYNLQSTFAGQPFYNADITPWIIGGILALVKAILMILQSRVLPSPDNAPTVISSTHIKASLKPMMIRYSTDVAIALGS